MLDSGLKSSFILGEHLLFGKQFPLLITKSYSLRRKQPLVVLQGPPQLAKVTFNALSFVPQELSLVSTHFIEFGAKLVVCSATSTVALQTDIDGLFPQTVDLFLKLSTLIVKSAQPLFKSAGEPRLGLKFKSLHLSLPIVECLLLLCELLLFRRDFIAFSLNVLRIRLELVGPSFYGIFPIGEGAAFLFVPSSLLV